MSNKRTPCHTDDYTKSYKSASEYLIYAISPPEKYNGEEDLPDKECLHGNKRIRSQQEIEKNIVDGLKTIKNLR